MSSAYLELGFTHILDLKGIDHILFVIVLCAVYIVSDWKKIMVLITAFTIGHSLTLALSSLKIVSISASLIETLIPVTIILTCLFNIIRGRASEDKVMINYALALGFGLIHGLGFSNFFKAMLGKDENIVMPLLSFNIGVEFGQIIIVIGTMVISFILVEILKVKHQVFNISLSTIILIVALWMLWTGF